MVRAGDVPFHDVDQGVESFLRGLLRRGKLNHPLVEAGGALRPQAALRLAPNLVSRSSSRVNRSSLSFTDSLTTPARSATETLRSATETLRLSIFASERAKLVASFPTLTSNCACISRMNSIFLSILVKRHGASSNLASCRDRLWNEVTINLGKKKTPRGPAAL